MTFRLLAAGVALASALGAVAASAQEFPSKPIRFVTPYPPGGATSLHAAILTTAAEPFFGQPMISIIRAGGGGVVGTTEVSKAEPDGHTVLFGDPTIISLRPQVEQLPFKADDFIPVARINYAPAVFVAGKNAPFSNLKEMADYAKANPDKLVYSSDNMNGLTYVAFEMLKKETGTKMKGVEFGGGGPAITQLLGGNTMAYAGLPTVVGEHITSGAVKPICVADTQRWDGFKDVPTCTEAGAPIIWHFWLGALVPKGTPADRVKRLSDGFGELVKDKGFLTLIGRINSRIDFQPHEEFAKTLEAERAALKALYVSLGKLPG